MFSKHEEEAISFHSCWKTEQQLSSGSSQTEPLEAKDQACQISDTKEVSVQTDKEESTNYEPADYNEATLLTFLQRVVPLVEKELDKAARSRAFDGYSDLDETTNAGARCLHTLRWHHALPEHVVIDVGWSSTGSVIGVGYGVRLHDDWCSHKGFVAVWNINRSDLAVNIPDQTMEISTCVTCLAFHPSNPALLAVGNMAGEVMVFDLSRTEDATPHLRGDSGGVSITHLKWVSLPTSGKIEGAVNFRSTLSLVSTTAEGAVLVWTIQQVKENLTLNSGYLVSSEDVPREYRSRLSDSGGVGLTGITFALDDSSRFFLGTESGAVLVCSSLLMERSNESVGGVGLNKCVTSSLYPHAGRVLQVAASMFHRHAVHTLGSDKNLRLYSLLQPNKPISVVYSEDEMTCSQWSPSRPLVVAVGKVTGEVSFLNFANKNGESALSLPAAEKPSPISCLVFNKSNVKLVACGDHLGRVFIWQLPEYFISSPAAEQNMFASMVQISSE